MKMGNIIRVKKVKRFLSLALAAILCVCSLPADASAGSAGLKGKDYHVVALGDSTGNGHGLDDFGFYSESMNSKNTGDWDLSYSHYQLGFLDRGSKSAYPAQLAAYIQQKHPEYDVSFTNLCISGIRNTELRALLDEDYTGDSFREII